MNSFVWIPSEEPARCLWDHCHSLETRCEPSLHHTRCHASDTSLCVRTPFSIEKKGKTRARHPASSTSWFCTCSCLCMLPSSSCQTNQAVRLAVRHSPAMLDTLSLPMSLLDTLIPMVWDNHCQNGASFSREKGSAWESSATEWGSWQSQGKLP